MGGPPAHKTKRLIEWLKTNRDKLDIFYSTLQPKAQSIGKFRFGVEDRYLQQETIVNKDQMIDDAKEIIQNRKNNRKTDTKIYS